MEKTKKSLAESPNVNLYFCGFRKTWIKYVQKAIQGIHVVSCKQGCVDKFIVSISARTSSYSTHKSWQYAHPNQLFLDQLAHPNLQCHLQWWTGCRVSSDQSWSWSCWTISLICLEQIACCWASLFLALRAITTRGTTLGAVSCGPLFKMWYGSSFWDNISMVPLFFCWLFKLLKAC